MADAQDEPPAPHGGGDAARPGATPGWGHRLGTLLAFGMEAATVMTILLQVVSVGAGVFCRFVLHRPLAGADVERRADPRDHEPRQPYPAP